MYGLQAQKCSQDFCWKESLLQMIVI
jgi:hypothetical protein